MMKIIPSEKDYKVILFINGLARAGPLAFRIRRKLLVLDLDQSYQSKEF